MPIALAACVYPLYLHFPHIGMLLEMGARAALCASPAVRAALSLAAQSPRHEVEEEGALSNTQQSQPPTP